MCGGVFFELEGAVYLNLGLRLEDGNENIEGANEILGSEFEAACQQALGRRKAASPALISCAEIQCFGRQASKSCQIEPTYFLTTCSLADPA